MAKTEKMEEAFPYRVLDLTDEKGFLCGAILANLGADVIKIERPGGDPSRNIGPFYHDIPDLEKSLYWFAYNAGKRGITLNIKTADGQEIFKTMAKTADFIIESFPVGYMDDLGIGYKALKQLNPRVIMTSISPFGQTGPYSQYKASDIVATAMGGLMYISGDADRPPVRPSVELSYMHAGAHAAIGSLIALHYREREGVGQHVDVSIQEAVVRQVYIETGLWEYTRSLYRRCGSRARRGTVMQKETWECKDGWISFRIMGGAYGRGIQPLVDWMKSDGIAGPLSNIDWSQVDIMTMTQEESDVWEDAFAKFFRQHTVKEIYDEAIKRRIYLLPAYTPKQITEDIQLKARDFWTKIDHEELGQALTYPGPAVRLSETPMHIGPRAPLIGEHNQEIYEKELGLSKEELVILKENGII